MRTRSVVEQDFLGLLAAQRLAKVAGASSNDLDDREELLLDELAAMGATQADINTLYDQHQADRTPRKTLALSGVC